MNADERNLASSIYDALRCMPAELCRLIGRYGIQPALAWSSNHPNLFVTCRPISRTETEIKSTDDRDCSWRTCISTTDLSAGCYEWNVEFRMHDLYLTPFGAGVTLSEPDRAEASDRNFRNTIAVDSDLIVSLDRQYHMTPFAVQLYNSEDLIRSVKIQLPADQQTFRIWFTADPATGIIRATCNGYPESDADDGLPIPPRISAAFSSVRPCVVLYGDTTAVVRCGRSADCPTDGGSLIVAVASVD
jgi:hypothetical protein